MRSHPVFGYLDGKIAVTSYFSTFSIIILLSCIQMQTSESSIRSRVLTASAGILRTKPLPGLETVLFNLPIDVQVYDFKIQKSGNPQHPSILESLSRRIFILSKNKYSNLMK